MNTRNAPLDDWQVREALIQAYNFEFINDTITGGRQPRIQSYFFNSDLAFKPGPATGRVAELLSGYSNLPPGVVEGYALPQSDGSKRNRANIKKARELLADAGWTVQDGVLKNAEGRALELHVLLQQDALISQATTMMDIYAQALQRIGIKLKIEMVDKAQYTERSAIYDYDLTFFRRALSLSPGNEQRLYWGSESSDTPGGRNMMGVKSPSIDGMIDAMLKAKSQDDFIAATRALDRLLTAGRYVIPVHHFDIGRIAHDAKLQYSENRLPLYGDGVGFLPTVWWYQD